MPETKSTMNNLMDRLWELIVGVDGVATSEIYRPSTTALHMCYPGIPINPDKFKDMWTPFNPKGTFSAAEAFSRWVDQIPDVTKLYFKPTTSTFEDSFGTIINGANAINKDPGEKEQSAYGKAHGYLYEKAINPFTGELDDQETETSLYKEYKKNRKKYQNAFNSLITAWTELDMSKSEDQRKWNSIGRALQSEVDNAWDDWVSSKKNYVEMALNTLGSECNNMTGYAINNAKKLFNNTSAPSVITPGANIHYSYALPDNWWDSSATGYTKINIKEDYSYLNTQSHTKSFDTSTSLSLGLFSMGGKGGWSEEKDSSTDDISNLTISLEIAIFDIIRPWASTGFMKTHNWYLDGEMAGTASSGDVKQQTNDMILPLEPVQFIVARNINLTGNWGEKSKEKIQQNINANADIGYGPFKISGKYEQSDKSETITSKFTGNTLSIEGMQIIGFVSAAPPLTAPKCDPSIEPKK